jgi:hypothetical protein
MSLTKYLPVADNRRNPAFPHVSASSKKEE